MNKTDKKIDTKREVTKLFKKWFVRRDNGNCQVLFALTELDDFVDEIDAVYNTEVQKEREEAVRGFWNHYFKEIAEYDNDDAGLPSPFSDFFLGLGSTPRQRKELENKLRGALIKYFAKKYETYLQTLKEKQ